MTEIDLSKYERIEVQSKFGDMYDKPARLSGFYSFKSADEAYYLKGSADTPENRSLLITIMCSGFFDRLDQINSEIKSDEDLSLVRAKIDGRWFDFLFWDSNYLDFDITCLAIWDETEQVWHTRL